jgi:hypothetical protein
MTALIAFPMFAAAGYSLIYLLGGVQHWVKDLICEGYFTEACITVRNACVHNAR